MSRVSAVSSLKSCDTKQCAKSYIIVLCPPPISVDIGNSFHIVFGLYLAGRHIISAYNCCFIFHRDCKLLLSAFTPGQYILIGSDIFGSDTGFLYNDNSLYSQDTDCVSTLPSIHIEGRGEYSIPRTGAQYPLNGEHPNHSTNQG